MVAILEIGALISSLSVGKIGDILGRRRTILYGALVFILGGAFQTFANGMPLAKVWKAPPRMNTRAPYRIVRRRPRISPILPTERDEIKAPISRIATIVPISALGG